MDGHRLGGRQAHSPLVGADLEELGAPRVKVTSTGVAPDHVNRSVAQIALMKSIGTTDTDFYSGLIGQLINVGSPGKEPDEAGTNFMLSIVKGIGPRDQLEAMLAAQMAAVHNGVDDVRATPRPCRQYSAARFRRTTQLQLGPDVPGLGKSGSRRADCYSAADKAGSRASSTSRSTCRS